MAVGPGFERELIEALQPIRGMALAMVIFHWFESGLYDRCARGPITVEDTPAAMAYNPERVREFLYYLRNEDLLSEEGGTFVLTDKGRALATFRPWYHFFVGGYAETFLELGDRLGARALPCRRNGRWVSVGSTEISAYDTVPLLASLISHAPRKITRALEIGCGDGGVLVKLCLELPELSAVGVDSNHASVRAGVDLLRRSGLGERVELIHLEAQNTALIDVHPAPDLIITSFLLQEVLGQSGEGEVLELLTTLSRQYPSAQFAVIEVDHRIQDPELMRTGLGGAYYNPYFLLHPFTAQRLLPAEVWERLFERAGLKIVRREGPDPAVDSTGLMLGYLLSRG
jgi:2-ketoarginine methyltransferase